jgi:pimeloyl-ACP methyl ester carboxylesterase
MKELIFIHGSGNTSVVWKYQIQYFPGAEAINLPGHLSPGEPCASIEDYVAWLHCYTLDRGYHATVLAGHSLGGAIVQMYALKHPEDVKAIILAGTGAKLRVAPQYLSMIQDGIEKPSIWLQEFIEPQYSRIEPELKKNLLAEMAKVGAKVQLNDFVCCDKFDILEKVNQIKVPTLVLCGSEDVMTPPKYSSYLAARIEGAKLSVVDGGTHYFFAEKPEVVNRAIEQFLLGL